MQLSTKDDLIAAYAAGTTSPGLSLLCEAHLSLSPESREDLACWEEIGGAFLMDDAAVALDDHDPSPCRSDREPSEEALFNRVLSAIDSDVTATPSGADRAAPVEDCGPLPGPLAAATEIRFDDIPWRFRLPGISEHVIEGFATERVSILRAKPGARTPQHTHRGVEATLVLTGQLKDRDRILTRGDVALCGPEHDHHPEIIGDEICYCLIVSHGALRFTGRFGRALNLFAE